MTLRFTKVTPVRSSQIFGWAVQMQDSNGKLVRVLVADKEHDPNGEWLHRRQAEIESAAMVKYAAGQTDPDGTVRT
jgi:hypothetical protein